jgi:hypothetical protein
MESRSLLAGSLASSPGAPHRSSAPTLDEGLELPGAGKAPER